MNDYRWGDDDGEDVCRIQRFQISRHRAVFGVVEAMQEHRLLGIFVRISSAADKHLPVLFLNSALTHISIQPAPSLTHTSIPSSPWCSLVQPSRTSLHTAIPKSSLTRTLPTYQHNYFEYYLVSFTFAMQLVMIYYLRIWILFD